MNVINNRTQTSFGLHRSGALLLRFTLFAVAVAGLVVGCGPQQTGSGDGGPDASMIPDGGPQPDAHDPSYFTDDDGDGYSEAQGDCDDTDILVVPFGVELCGDGVDNNCNGATDADEPDVDGDGFGPCNGDCDDGDPTISPAAEEVVDGIDNNCDGIVDQDLDGDGFTVNQGDCDDADPDVNPDAEENCYDGVDNDCNGVSDGLEPDLDGDGFGPCDGDCDDSDPNIGPNQPEIAGDGIDNNCDFLVDEDVDGDGWTIQNGDCDDNDPAVHPAAIEDCSDGIDNNCNNITDTDCMSPCDLATLMRSSVGCVYYAVDTNPIHSVVPGDFAVAISNVDSSQTANVVIEVKNGATWSTVSGGAMSIGPLSLQSLALPHRYIAGSAIYAGGAYRITSDLPVVAYQFNPLDGANSFLSDASLLLPESAYDRYYVVPAWPYGPSDSSTSSGHPAHIQIVASTATEVRVISPVVTVSGAGVPSLTPMVQAAFNLDEGDYLQLTIQNFMDSFTGTYIESDEPIGVFSSNDCANVPTGPGAQCCCEHLEEQVFGLQTWGTTYVAARVPQRGSEPSLWQILASEDNTTVTFNASGSVTGLPPSVVLNAGEYVEYMVNGPAANPGDFLVTADEPILVTQFMVAGSMAGGSANGDPSMVQAVPVEQFLDTYVVLVPNTWVNDFFVLVREQGETVNIDGSPVTSGWTAVGTSGYEVARVSVADGVHTLSGSAPFGVVVIGYDSYDSYAYPGGLDQQLINPIL